ncbi:MAG: protein kinase [Verrucomicrobiaceae bacterium]|nr:protein kinase [Verrucomicrobiaceae bacterium]
MPEVPPPGSTPTGYQRTQGGGVAWSPPSAAHLEQLLPQYHVECLLGRGGMGAVYKGLQKSLERPVAIKILPPDLDDADASYTQRFKNEAKLMAKMNHPAIVHVYDYGVIDGRALAAGRALAPASAAGTPPACDATRDDGDGSRPAAAAGGPAAPPSGPPLFYFVMEFVNGTDVQQMIQAQGRLPPEHALAVTAHVCDALKYAHEHGVIHRDIKPANVLINMEGAVKVADFGLAKASDGGTTGITKTGMAMGTPDYVAPEALVMGVDVDARADVYAVGVMLYTMLTGHVPRGAFKPPSVMVPGVDRRFDAIVERAMQMNRDERYPGAAHIRRDLDAILTAPQVQAGGQSSAAVPRQVVAQKPVSKGPQKPMGKSANVPVDGRRVRQNAEEAAGTPDRTLASAPTGKSKTPLLIGIGAVAAIAVGAFVMMGGEGRRVRQNAESAATSSGIPSGAAQLASSPTSSAKPIKVREEPKPAVAPISNSKSPISNPAPAKPTDQTLASSPTSGAAAKDKFPPGQWVKVFTKFEDLPEELRKPDAQVKIDDGKLTITSTNAQKILCSSLAFSSAGIRVKQSPKSAETQLSLARESDHTSIRMLLRPGVDDIYIQRWKPNGSMELARLREPRGVERSLELAVVGSTVIARAGGQISRSQIPPSEVIAPFKPELYAAEASLRDIEVINLDGIPEAEALKLIGVDENGNDLRDPAKTIASSTPAPAPTSLPVSSTSSQVLPPREMLEYKLPLSAPQRPKQPCRVVVWRLDGKPLSQEESVLTPPPDLKGVVQMAASNSGDGNGGWITHAVALKADGHVATWGQCSKVNDVPRDLDNVVKVVAASTRCLALQANGKLRTWGQVINHVELAAHQGEFVDVTAADAVDIGLTKNGEAFGRMSPTAKARQKEFGPFVALGSTKSGFSPAITRSGQLCQLHVPGDERVMPPGDFLRRRFTSWVVLSGTTPRRTVAFDDQGIVGVWPESQAAEFAGITALANWDDCTAMRKTDGTWVFKATEKQIDAAYCAEQARDCVSVSLTDKYAFGLKPEAVVAAAAAAKQADTIATIPELKTLHEQFVKLQGERVTAPFEADVAKLNTSYLGGLDREIEKEKKAGHLDGVLALEAEKKLIVERASRSSSDANERDARSTTTLPIPAEDDDTTPASLKALRKIYRETFSKHEATRAANLKQLTDPLTIRLKQLESTLTQQNRINEAKTVREYRESLDRALENAAEVSPSNLIRSGTDDSSLPFVPPLSRKPGKLHGWGQFLNKPFDVSKAEKYSDFVQVALTDSQWLALRANGETVSTEGAYDGMKGVYAIKALINNFTLITKKGVIATANGTRETIEPSAWGGGRLRDAAVSVGGIEVFVRDDGTVRLRDTGLRKGKAAIQPNKAHDFTKEIRNAVQCATAGPFTFVLTADGKTYGWTGPLFSTDKVSDRDVSPVDLSAVPADVQSIGAAAGGGIAGLRLTTRSGSYMEFNSPYDQLKFESVTFNLPPPPGSVKGMSMQGGGMAILRLKTGMFYNNGGSKTSAQIRTMPESTDIVAVVNTFNDAKLGQVNNECILWVE